MPLAVVPWRGSKREAEAIARYEIELAANVVRILVWIDNEGHFVRIGEAIVLAKVRWK